MVIDPQFLPDSGQECCSYTADECMLTGVPGVEGPYGDLIDHLTRTSPLSEGEAARVIADILGYFAEPSDEFVRRRHRELKAKGLTNEEAFGTIAAELPLRRVIPPQYTLRQLRRLVYG